jgi:hypothetical protein
MSKIALTGDASGTGTLTIAAPNTNTDRTLTLPDEAGTVLTSGGAIDVDPSAPADSVAIDSSGNVGVGTSSPSTPLHIASSTGDTSVKIESTFAGGDARLELIGNSAGVSQIRFGDENSANIGLLTYNHTDDSMAFRANGGESARIDSSGNLLVGKTSSSLSTAGFEAKSSGEVFCVRNSDTPLQINRLGNDGALVGFYQATSLEGTISVSGSTVSYNGGHLSRWSQLADNTRDETILKGTVMTNLDQMAEWTTDGVTEANEQLNCMAVSSVEGDPNVAGVFVNWDNDDDVYTNDMNIAMTGDMIIRIAAGTTVARGDLLMSAGDGTAKPQGDDIVRSKTIAKVTSTHVTCTYDDGSYCVPCVLMAC